LFKESKPIQIEREHSVSSIPRYYLHSPQFAGLPDTQIHAVARDLIVTINKKLESRPVIMGLPITIRADGSRQPLTVITSVLAAPIENLLTQVTDINIPISTHGSYPEILLTQARQFIDADHYNIGIVLAHTACEVATEQAMSEAFSAKGLQLLKDAVMRLLSGYNLANERIRNLYAALTGDNIKLPGGFDCSSGRRNRIVHEGASVTKQEAGESFEACSALVSHVITVVHRGVP
jgi:hypothetical protein